MQKYSQVLSKEEARIARRWTVASLGFYGSILAGMILYAAFSRDSDTQLAASDSTATISVATAARQAPKRPEPATRRAP